MADVLRIRLLGAFEASSGERRVPPGGWRLRKARTLVKLLALNPAHALHVDQVADALWPDGEVRSTRNNLHQVLHAARRALSSLGIDHGAALTWHDDLLTLAPDVELGVDVEQLRAEVDAALSAGDVERATVLLHESSPELLPEDAYESWVQPYAIAFREWRTKVVLDVAEQQTAAGAAERAVVLLAPVTASDPLNERAIRALMRALASSGRRPEALTRYERLRAELREQLGADPEPETRAMFHQLLTESSAVAQGPAAHRVPVPAQRPTPALPSRVSSVVGRARELDEAALLLRRTRLLTLTGMGGVGKTTLAVSLARRVAADYPDGAHLVELGALGNGDQVVPQLARALHVALPPDFSSVDAIVAQLRDRTMVVVLDNCEHLLDACAAVVSSLLHGCPALRVLATSREPLRVEGEVTWRTPSLTLPDADCTGSEELRGVASVDLFVQRAAAAVPGFELTDDNAASVAAICRRLDGIPLALELAAACTPLLAPAQIEARLGDAMGLLRRGDRALTRQQTLEATLTWSHDLLTPDEQVVLRRLAVFAGSFTLDAVEAVCADGLSPDRVVAALTRLVDTSLLATDAQGRTTRYRLLDTVRQYAMERLRASHEQLDVERRHCQWYRQFAAARDPELQLLVTVAPASLDVEHDNLRAAIAWALRQDPPLGLELSVSLWRYWLARGLLAEGCRWLESALDAAADPSPSRARALLALGAFDIRRGRGERLPDLAREAVAIHRSRHDRGELAQSLCVEATFDFLLGAWETCWERTVESRAVAAGAAELEVGARHLQGVVCAAQGRLDDAREAFDEVRSLGSSARDSARPFLRPVSQGFAIERGPAGEPRVYFEETVLHGRIVGGQQAQAHVLCNVADVARACGDLDKALRSVCDAEELFRTIGDADGEAVALSRRGCLHRVRREYAAGRDALEHALTLREASGDRRAAALTRTNLGLLLAAEGDLDAGCAVIVEQIARAREIRDAAAQAGMTLTLASVLATAGDDAGAAARLGEVLAPPASLPGCHLPVAWASLMHACVLDRLGRADAARDARAEAGQRFARLGAVDGLAALATPTGTQSRG